VRSIALVLLVLSGVANSQLTKRSNEPAEIEHPNIWEHRIGPFKALHRSPDEMEALEKDSFRHVHRSGQCIFAVVVSADGTVESAQLLKSSSTCAPHQQEATEMLHSRSYRPWLVDGNPARVRIEDTVEIYPPERWGDPVEFPKEVDRKTLLIQLDRTLCYGTCHDYVVSITGDGSVSFDGRHEVLVPGHHTAKISTETVDQLLDMFRAANFLSALPQYRGNWTDNPTQTLTLRVNGQTKTVIDYVGTDVGLPLAIRNLENAIDDTAGTERWIKINQETMAALEAEHWNFSSASLDNLALYRKAIQSNNTSLIRAFLHAKTPPEATLDKSAPPICIASQAGNLKLVNEMLPLTETLPKPVTDRCLSDAAESGNLELMELWLAKGADPRAHVEADGEDWIASFGALAGAADSGNPEMVRKLLRYGLNANVRIQEWPLLLWAIERGRGDTAGVVDLLIQGGADVNTRTNSGQTALFVCRHKPELVKPLVAAGADLEARDRNGQTALIRMAFSPGLVRALLENGADPAATTPKGDTALQRAKADQCAECVTLIENALKKKSMLQN